MEVRFGADLGFVRAYHNFLSQNEGQEEAR